MGSLTPLKLPIIEISMKDLKPETKSWYLVRYQVRKALEEYGCFEAVYNGVSLELHEAVFRGAEDLFDLPLQTKMLNISENIYHGYVGPISEVPLYEGLGIDEPLHLKNVKGFTNLMWPEGNTNFCETMYSFASRMGELEQMIKRMVIESFGLEKYLNCLIESSTYVLRVTKYTEPLKTEATVGLRSHTDKGYLTILHQNKVKGLEIQTKDDEWIRHSPSSADSFVVMVGEALMAWSNGRLHSPQHQVMLNGNDARYSTAFFSARNGIIQTPEELVDEEHPLLFKPFNPTDLLRFFYTEEGQKAECTVKAFCGV